MGGFGEVWKFVDVRGLAVKVVGEIGFFEEFALRGWEDERVEAQVEDLGAGEGVFEVIAAGY